MAYGLECWSASGIKTLSITDRITRLISVIPVSFSTASWVRVEVPSLANDGTWAVIINSDWANIRLGSGYFEVRHSRELRELTYTAYVLRF